MALIKGKLEEAQLEPYTTGTRPTASSYPYRVIWNTSTSEAQVSDGSSWIPLGAASVQNRVAALYDAVLGSAGQVTSGAATHSTWATAIAALSAGDTLKVLEGSWTENVTVDKSLHIEGNGFGSVLTGSITFNSSSDQSSLSQVKVSDNITLSAGADGVIIKNIWLANGKSFLVDNTVVGEIVEASLY